MCLKKIGMAHIKKKQMQFLWLGNKSPKIPVLAVLPKEKLDVK